MFHRLKGILSDFFQQADLVLLTLCCVSTLYGIALIFSATRYKGGYRFVLVQGVALVIGICLYIFLSMVDVEILVKRWKWIVTFNVVIILLLIPFGRSVDGNRAWLRFPFLPVDIGPAELVKISFTILLAKQLEWLREDTPWRCADCIS